MKTLTLTSELNNDKEARRTDYVRRDRSQDHGTRGTGKDNDWYGRTPAQIRDATIAKLALMDGPSGNDDLLARMTPSELTKSADAILSAAGFEQPGPEDSELVFASVSGQNPMHYEGEPVEDPQDGYVHSPDFVSIADTQPSGYATDFEAEVYGILDGRRAQIRNADRVYQGQIDPGDDMGDFVASGFHLTDRP